MSVITLDQFHKEFGPGRKPHPRAFGIDKCIKPELEAPVLTALVDHLKARRVVEIGINAGATAAAILAGNETIEEYIGIDLPKIWFVDAPAGQHALADPRLTILQPEHGARDIDPEEIGKVDFVFIDADHSYDAVSKDTDLARQLIRPGGILAWHDYQHPGNPDVKKYIHAVNNDQEHPIVYADGTTICYQIAPEEKKAKKSRTRKKK